MSGASGLRKHGHLSDGDGGTVSTSVVYAECNTSPTGAVNVPWDKFYDVGQNDTSGVIPAGVGLSYATGTFTALEDGVWILSLGVDLTAAPGSTGYLLISGPTYGYNPKVNLAASGNPANWQVERTIVMHTGDVFRLVQSATGGVSNINGYAVLEIYRVARAVS